MGGTTNVHGQVHLLIPRHGTGEASDVTEVDGQVAVDDSDTVVVTCSDAIGVIASLCPEQCATRQGVVELELDVVEAIGNNGTSGRLQASLEVEVVAGGGIRGGYVRVCARKEKQG